jgi:hypothetical protein
MGQAGLNTENKTASSRLPGQGCQDRAARINCQTGLPAQDCWDKTARAGQKGEDSQNRTATTAQPKKDS